MSQEEANNFYLALPDLSNETILDALVSARSCLKKDFCDTCVALGLDSHDDIYFSLSGTHDYTGVLYEMMSDPEYLEKKTKNRTRNQKRTHS